MEKELLLDMSKNFAVQIIQLCESINSKKAKNVLVSQILRSATSIGANISEAKYAQSRYDFISKMEIALKENNETSYWLDVLFKSGYIYENDYKNCIEKCGTIRRKLISSITTAKKNAGKI
jgi:four helix bundle protein